MAIIQRIRTRAGLLLAVVIGLALLAFILGDLFNSGTSLRSKSQMNIAKINGKKVGYREYQNTYANIEGIIKARYQTSQLNESTIESIRNQAWQELIQKYVLNEEYSELGLAVSNNEFADLIQGENPHPMIAEMFPNPETGGLDRLRLADFLAHIDEITGATKAIWVYYEKIISEQRLINKYNSLVSKGLYANKLDIAQQVEANSTTVDISYIKKLYTEISDDVVVITEPEMRKYYKENISKYQQEESRELQYVAFDIIPSEQDYKDAEAWINDSQEELKVVEDVEQYINFNSPPYDNTNYKKGELPENMDDFMFSSELGAVFGPYFEDNTYKLAKLAKIQYLSDSVRASHILLPADQSNAEQMRLLADSLKTAAENGVSFDLLVKDNSRDLESALSGGDLGWFKEGMISPFFSDSCFYAEKGDIKLTFSDQGFHVVKITNKSKEVKKVQVGVLAREVVAGSETDQVFYSKAVEFASNATTPELFNKTAAEKNLRVVPVYDVQPLDRELGGLENTRNIVYWAFSQSEAGMLMNDINEYNDKYVVAMLTKVNNAGAKSFEDVKGEIETILTKSKKAEMLAQQLNDAVSTSTDINSAASTLGSSVESATGIKFSSVMINGVGGELALIAAAVNGNEQELSEPVEGENGVYVYTVDSKNTADMGMNPSFNKMLIEQGYAQRASYQILPKLEDLCNIEDYRYRFF